MSGMTTEPTSFPAIEIFRAGTHTGDDGRAWTFSDADLRAIAAAYDPETSEAPIVIGHPATDAPAYGWVASVLFADGRLSITARDVEPQFAGMVRARRFSKRSAAFYTPEHPNNPKPGQWYLRHVGFLGAQPPAVKGLKEIRFADATLVVFAETLYDPPRSLRSLPPEGATPSLGRPGGRRTAPRILTRLACDIARYHLHDDLAPEHEVRRRYRAVIDVLTAIADGDILLTCPLGDAPGETLPLAGAGETEYQFSPRQVTDADLKGFAK